MRNWNKRLTALGCCMLMLVMTACGSSAGKAPAESADKLDDVYRSEEITVEADLLSMESRLFSRAGKLYLTGTQYNEEGTTCFLAELAEDFSVKQKLVIDCGDSDNIRSIDVLSTGDVVCVRTTYGENGDSFTLERYAMDGTQKYAVPIEHQNNPDEYYFIESMALGAGDEIVLYDGQKLVLFGSEDGSKVREIEKAETSTMVRGASGDILLCSLSDYKIRKLDLKSGTLTETGTVMADRLAYSLCEGGAESTLLATGSDGIYAINLDGSEPKKLCDYVNSDLYVENMSSLVNLKQGEFIGISGTYAMKEGGNSVSMMHLTKVKPEELKSKKLIRLGATYMMGEVSRMVVEFNKKDPDYRITIEDYSRYDSEANEWTGSTTTMNNDIVTGKAPDILFLSFNMPVESYMNKGVLLDLNPMYQRDIDESKIFSNIEDALMSNGKRYCVTNGGYLQTAFMRRKVAGDRTGWTPAEAMELAEQQGIPISNMFGQISDKDMFLQTAMYYGGSSYVDWEKQTSSFDSDGFISLLKMTDAYPAKVTEDDYNVDHSADFRSGKALAMMYSLSRPQDYNMVKKGSFGDDIVPIGFPTESKISVYIVPETLMAINASSAEPEGAWKFIKSFLDEEYQADLRYTMPVSRSAMDVQLEEASHKPYYTDENNQRVEYDDTTYVGGQEIVIEPMNETDRAEFLSIVEGAHDILTMDNKINTIVQEESGAYLAGQKSAEDVAKIIQSKVSIYVSENS